MPEGRRLAPESEPKKKQKSRSDAPRRRGRAETKDDRIPAEQAPVFSDVTEPLATARREEQAPKQDRKRSHRTKEPRGTQKGEPAKEESVAKGYLKLLIRIAALALIFWLLLTQVFQICQISGNAMFPAVKDGDLLFGFRLESSYAKNDVVIYRQDGQRRAGRVIAAAGDVVNITDQGEVLVNGTTQSGEILYPTEPGDDLTYPYTVPEDSVFILGDYRTQSADSRIFGAVSVKNVESKVFTLMRRRGL